MTFIAVKPTLCQKHSQVILEKISVCNVLAVTVERKGRLLQFSYAFYIPLIKATVNTYIFFFQVIKLKTNGKLLESVICYSEKEGRQL